MVNNDMLATLRDIHLPAPIPPYGLFITIAIVSFLTLLGLLFYMRHRYKYRVKRVALRQLRRLEKEYQTTLTPETAPTWIATLCHQLRAVAQVYVPHLFLTPTPDLWVDGLITTDTAFAEESMRIALCEGPYRPSYPMEHLPTLLLHTKKWIQQQGGICLR